jgi:hypothetical protein
VNRQLFKLADSSAIVDRRVKASFRRPSNVHTRNMAGSMQTYRGCARTARAGFSGAFGRPVLPLFRKRDFLRTMTPALLTDGLRIEGGI